MDAAEGDETDLVRPDGRLTRVRARMREPRRAGQYVRVRADQTVCPYAFDDADADYSGPMWVPFAAVMRDPALLQALTFRAYKPRMVPDGVAEDWHGWRGSAWERRLYTFDL